MYTVLIADQETLAMFEENRIFMESLFAPEAVGLCQWNPGGSNLDNMLPGLYHLIANRREWRAVILSRYGRNQQNPFDFTAYRDASGAAGQTLWQALEQRRNRRFDCYRAALDNPLLRLTCALTGKQGFQNVIREPQIMEALLGGQMSLQEYMLKAQLQHLNLAHTAAVLERYEQEALAGFVQPDQISGLLEYLRAGDTAGILSLIPRDSVLDFIRLVGGNDPVYCDPEYAQCALENTFKQNLLQTLEKDFSMRDTLPSEVICLAPRTFDGEQVAQETAWKKKDERTYSRFAEFNLYHKSLRFLVFDMLPQDHRQYAFDTVRLTSLMMLLAANGIPQGVASPERLYRVDIRFDGQVIGGACRDYLSKLKATELHLLDLQEQLDREESRHLDEKTANRLFNADVYIPVNVGSLDELKALRASHEHIGLAGDCPEDEQSNWSGQYRQISKRFVRFLREPRRAVTHAASVDFPRERVVRDDRVVRLSATQLEDIRDRLHEEEQRLTQIKATHLFNTAAYSRQIQEAERGVRQCAGQRMSRKKTLIIAAISLLVYLVSFIPLVLGNLNTAQATQIAVICGAAAAVALALVGFVALLVFRRQLIGKFRQFNRVMGNIYREIQEGIGRFSSYISCACGIMRRFAVLRQAGDTVSESRQALNFHKTRIAERIREVVAAFSPYTAMTELDISGCEPYEYDYCVMREYPFSTPVFSSRRRIEYLQPGHEVVAGVEYVSAITLEREELYD